MSHDYQSPSEMGAIVALLSLTVGLSKIKISKITFVDHRHFIEGFASPTRALMGLLKDLGVPVGVTAERVAISQFSNPI